MSLPVITVIIPTVAGREEYFDRCWRAYTDLAAGQYELDLVIERDHSTCGLAWQAGTERMSTYSQYVHFTCDDIVPRPGWVVPAAEAAGRGFIPAPQVYGPDGTPQSHPQVGQVGTDWAEVYMTALPFVSRGQLEKIVPLLCTHYYSDDWFSYRARRAGWSTVLRTGYAFTHYYAQHLRGAGMTEDQRMRYDQGLYEQAKKMAESGEWNAPWPSVNIARPLL